MYHYISTMCLIHCLISYNRGSYVPHVVTIYYCFTRNCPQGHVCRFVDSWIRDKHRMHSQECRKLELYCHLKDCDICYEALISCISGDETWYNGIISCDNISFKMLILWRSSEYSRISGSIWWCCIRYVIINVTKYSNPFNIPETCKSSRVCRKSVVGQQGKLDNYLCYHMTIPHLFNYLREIHTHRYILQVSQLWE